MLNKTLITIALSFFIGGCSDYIAAKREGLKKFNAEPDEKQAQESRPDESTSEQ